MAPGRATSDHSASIQLLLVPLLFYVGAKLSLALAVMPDVLVTLWIPNSIVLTALLHYGWRRYGYFCAAVVVADIAADYPTFTLAEASLFGAINLLEATVAYALLRRWRFDPRFATPKDIAKFVIAGPMIAALLSACAAGFVYSAVRGTDTTFIQLARVWWFSDGLGLLILTPLVISLWAPVPTARESWPRLRWYDALAIGTSLVVVAAFMFSEQRVFYDLTLRPFLLIPPVLYAAARFDMRIVASVVGAVSLALLYVVKSGEQPFGPLPIRETVASAQELIFTMSIMALGFTALLFQQRETLRELERRVIERTADLTRANTELQRLAITDSLTSVLNRGALFNALHRELSRSQRHGHPLAVIMFDIDHFKLVNDQYGHAAGDEVLRHVTAVAGALVRSSDVIGRYGGEEFVIVAPDTAEDMALQLAERIRNKLRETAVGVKTDVLHVTASFGITMLEAEDHVAEQVLQRADEALYAAKRYGRDRVVVSGVGRPPIELARERV